MRLQHLAVIFVIIILPIALVLSTYINNHITTIERQIQYDTKLANSTYDAMKAFQINTFNNRYSTLNNSKIRDIEAGISTFYRTFGSSMGVANYGAEGLQLYTPAILCTLYDGYYIYTKYYDTELEDYTYGLKPLISYSCRYVSGSNYDFIVNYTLDNRITVIGTVNGESITKSGSLISEDLSYSIIGEDRLEEQLLTINNDGRPEVKTYPYIIYGNERK